MEPVDQTTPTNCFQACLASILELPIADVPDVMNAADLPTPSHWLWPLQDWLQTLGLGVLCAVPQDPDFARFHSNAWLIAAGHSWREHEGHAVVWRDGAMVHDPHQARGGLRGEPREFYFFYLLDPADR